MEQNDIPIHEFIAISALLTGCDSAMLQGTGMTMAYADQLVTNLGPANTQQFMQAAATVLPIANEKKQHQALEELFHHYKFGAICQNIIQMWYTGTWFAMPTQWQNLFGDGMPPQQSVTVNNLSYQQGLVWDIAQAHPPGAKQPGFGSWHFRPDTNQPESPR